MYINRYIDDVNLQSWSLYVFFFQFIIKTFSVALGNGDPHYTTFDGVLYHEMQGRGDFTTMQIVPNGQTQPIVRLDAFLNTRIGWSPATTGHLGVALGTAQAAVHVCL